MLLFADLMPLFGECRLILAENNFRVLKFFRNRRHEKIRQLSIARIKKGEASFREDFGKKITAKTQRYRLREVSGQMAGDDPVDIEMFFLYLLSYALELKETEFPALYQAINECRSIMNRTFNYRRKQRQTAL